MKPLIERTVTLEYAVKSANIAARFDKTDCQILANHAVEGYEADVSSRVEWERRQANANKLALQVFEGKTEPWPGASAVKFPLITNAALQYQAKAYAALVSGTDLVKCRTFGEDPTGEKSARAQRLSAHMSWQNLREDRGWEEGQDKLLLIQAIAGTVFKKRVFDPVKRRQVSRLVLPEDFVIAYNSQSIHEAARYTHRFNLSHNDVAQREMDGRFRKPDAGLAPETGAVNEIVAARERREGVTDTGADDTATPYGTAEQACWLDLDGDGYQEPYLITFDIGSGVLRRLAARFMPSGIKDKKGNIYKSGGSVYSIEPVPMFVKYDFIPSPDGGFYALGLGTLLGPINESINTSVNQIHDAATMQNMGGGFYNRRAFNSGKGGPIRFTPNTWHPSDGGGDDLRKNILPLPVREPSAVLLQLIGLLLQYAERIVSATDLQVGEDIGQNTPAETARTMNANGARVYNGIYKRTWRAERDEFDMQFELNRLFLSEDARFTDLTTGKSAMIRADDYSGTDIDVAPEADPHIMSDEEGVRQATMLVQLASSSPGYNRYQAHRRLLKAMKVSSVDEVLPPPMTQGPDGKPAPAKDFPPAPDAKMLAVQVKQGELQLKGQQFQADAMEAKIRLQLEVDESFARTQELRAKAELEIAQSKSEEVEPQIKLIFAQIEAEGAHRDRVLKLLDIISTSAQKSKESSDAGAGNGGQTGGNGGMAGMALASANAAIPGISSGNGAAASAGLGGSPL